MKKHRCLILGVDYFRDGNFNYYMEELNNLVSAAGFNPVKQITQKLEQIDQKSYLRKGKMQEVIDYLDGEDIDLIIVNNELSGMMNRNLEELTGKKIMDRTQLILEIFAIRARTKEAKLQVAIAQLRYNLPRMVGSYGNLSRQGGGKVGTVARGSGEKKIELDKRRIREKIKFLETELQSYKKARKIQREKRNENSIPIVAVVGYTNAGKSTLMNHFVSEEKQVFEKDMLFATLDTTVRQIKTKGKQEFLLIDTVGFVSNLPHELVKAFGSTLEEIADANLIVHLEDGLSPYRDIHEKVVNETLAQLELKDKKVIRVINKADAISESNDETLKISAKTGYNIAEFIDLIEQELFVDYKEVHLQIAYDEMNILDAIRKYNLVTKIEYNEHGVCFNAKLAQEDIQRYQRFIVE